jgi:hypothetical protein
MNPWICASLIALAGAIGGVINALLTDNGFVLPSRIEGVWCPGFVTNILVGAFSAFASWSFYGSGASIDLAQMSERAQISLRFSALAGALLVGVAGARWITNEADKQLLKVSVKEAAKKPIPEEVCDQILRSPAKAILESVRSA